MMIITGTVVSVERDVDIPKKDGGSYVGTRLTYRDNQGNLKEQNWHPNGLKYNHAVRNSLDEMQAGEKFTMTKEKGDNGIWNVKTLIKGVAGATPQQGKSYTPSNNNSNTFEVNNQLKEKQMKFDELRQPIYVRQTALKAASELATVLKLKTEQDVLDQAVRFVKYIETGDTGDMNGLVSDDLDSGIE
jgi:hypothetical protein